MVFLDGVTVTDVARMPSVTVTVQEADLPLPSLAVAVMMAVPFARAETQPPLTVATAALLLLQESERSVAFSGQTVAERETVMPMFSDMTIRFSSTEFTGTAALVTVTVR